MPRNVGVKSNIINFVEFIYLGCVVMQFRTIILVFNDVKTTQVER